MSLHSSDDIPSDDDMMTMDLDSDMSDSDGDDIERDPNNQTM
jgi:hypothetical protein